MLKAGDRAPDFSNPDADMAYVSLADCIGSQRLVLFFYVRDNTPGCTTEALEFSDLEQAFARLNTVVIGVSRDDCIKHGEFSEKHGIGVRLLSDSEETTCAAYGVLQEKEVDGVKRIGVLRSTFVIDQHGVIQHALYGVSSRGHAAEVLQLLKEQA